MWTSNCHHSLGQTEMVTKSWKTAWRGGGTICSALTLFSFTCWFITKSDYTRQWTSAMVGTVLRGRPLTHTHAHKSAKKGKW